MSKQQVVSSTIVMPAFNEEGIYLPDQRVTVSNSPAGEYLKDVPFITIVTGTNPISANAKKVEAEIAEFEKPVVIKPLSDEAYASWNPRKLKEARKYIEPLVGKSFYKGFWWGSGVKEGRVTGVPSDIAAEKGILRFTEDRYRLNRAYLSNATVAMRGAWIVESFEIAGIIGDGMGYTRESVAAQMRPDRRFNPVSMGKWNSSFSFLQRFSYTPALHEELMDSYTEGLAELAVNGWDLRLAKGANIETKTHFCQVDEAMKEHPFVASALSEARAQQMFRLATAGGFLMDGGVMVPTTSDNLVLPPTRRFEGRKGKALSTRYPIDSDGSIRVTETEKDTEESKRIGKMEILQYTLTAKFDHTWKGLLGVMPDAEFNEMFGEDIDIAVSVEDLKMSKDDIKKVPARWELDDATLSITQWFLEGSGFGVPAKLAKDLNADFDGDQKAIIFGEDFPEMLRQAQGFKQLRNPKLPKTKTPIVVGQQDGHRALLSMANLVGQATNVVSTVLSVVDQEMIAIDLGWNNADQMHEWFMKAIKVGTDIFKTSVDYRPFSKRLGQVSTLLRRMGVVAPWTKWRNDDVAFRHELPPVTINTTSLTKWQQKNLVLSEGYEDRQDAIIGTLLRWILPQMQLPEITPIKPLSWFRDWAVEPANHSPARVWAQKLLVRYAERVSTMNFSDDNAWAQYREEWRAAISHVCKAQDIDRDQMASALWYLSHDNQRMSSLSTIASAVFVGMPDEADKIIAEKPGKIAARTVIVNGLKWQLPNAQPGMTFPAKVVAFVDEMKSGDLVNRVALVSTYELPGYKAPEKTCYPKGSIGVLAIQEYFENAEVTATLVRKGSSWAAELH